MNMMNQQQEQSVPGEVQRQPNRIISFFLHFLLPTAALICGVAITIYLLKTSPEAKPRKRPPTATLVKVQQVKQGPQQTVITSMGEVIPAREIDLKPRVSGAITTVSDEFIPGGYFPAGATLLQIDPADYKLTVQQLESESARAESDLLMEMGYQRIAAKEYQLLGEQVSEEEQALILRKPQLTKLQAAKTVAQTQLAKARLDLERTRVTAPFNSVIATRNVDTGARINESTILAHLVGTDAFWLRLSLPIEQLKWVRIPSGGDEEGSTVRIFPQGSNGSDTYRTGKVVRLAASLEEQGRMAQLLVQVEDPLNLREENATKPRLLLGSYVRAEIEGVTIPSAISVDRSHIHEGRYIWLMNDDGLLDIREVSVVFRNRDQVIIHNSIKPDERIVTSTLSSPVAGIPLRLEEDILQDVQSPGKKAGGRVAQSGEKPLTAVSSSVQDSVGRVNSDQ